MNKKYINKTSEKYISDVSFQSSYDRSLNPLFIHYISILNGVEQCTFNTNFRYCDLGCGDGSTINTLACLFPSAKFYGIDFNKAHINSAKKTAYHAGLENISYHQLDFSNLDSLDLPDLDFISCIGAFSWVNQVLQKGIIKFAGARLADNGKFIVQYTAKPGKVQVDPLWHFMREVSADGNTNSLERAKTGVKHAEIMIEKGAKFFEENPVALNIASNLHKRSIHNIAHNALSEFQVLNYSDIAREVFKYGMSFAGSTSLIENHMSLNIPDRFNDDINNLSNPFAKETMKDFILNRGLRSDIYIKNITGSAATGLLDEMYFGMSLLMDKSPGTMYFQSGTSINYDEPLYTSLIKILSNKTLKLPELALEDELQKHTKNDISDALHMLIAVGIIVPYKEPGKISNIDSVKGLKPTSLSADEILQSQIGLNQSTFLPSSYAGQSFAVGPVMALFLKAHIIYKEDDPVEWISTLFTNHGFPLKLQNADINSMSQLRNMLEQSHERFTQLFLPWLIKVGILE